VKLNSHQDRPLSPLMQLVKSRLLEFIRQPEAVFWVYLFPILMVIALGSAFRTQTIESFDVVIEAGQKAENIARVLEDAEGKIFQTEILAVEDAATKLRIGKTTLVIGVKDDNYVYKYDPTRPGSMAAKSAVDTELQKAEGRTDAFVAIEEAKSDPGGRYIDFLVPGLLGMGLMGGGLFGVGFAIVDLRIRKLLKLFMATPMKRSHFLLSLMLSRMVFMVPEVILLLVFSWLFFGVTVYGSWLLILLLIVVGSIQFAGIGLLIASRVKTLEAASGLLNLAMLPMWTLCGIFFSYDRFPDFLHPFIRLLPLTPVVDSLRAVMLEGAGIAQIWPELINMSLWGVISFGIALLIFRWRD